MLPQTTSRFARWPWLPLLLRLLGALVAFVALARVGMHAELVGGPKPRGLTGAMHFATASLGQFATVETPADCDGDDKDAGPKAMTEDGRVILNLAGVDELVTLPGVGDKRAKAILALRKRLGGRFRSVRDLLRVKGIGYRSLKKLAPKVVLDPPKPKEKPKEKPKGEPEDKPKNDPDKTLQRSNPKPRAQGEFSSGSVASTPASSG